MRITLRPLKALLITVALLPAEAALIFTVSPARAAQDKTGGRGESVPEQARRQGTRQTPRPKPRLPQPHRPALRPTTQEPSLPYTDIAHLDRFAIELRREPPASDGYIICYAGRDDMSNKARRRCELAKNYLVKTHGFDAARLQVMDGGYREKFTVELWVVPEGSQPPALSPTLMTEQVRQYQQRLRP